MNETKNNIKLSAEQKKHIEDAVWYGLVYSHDDSEKSLADYAIEVANDITKFLETGEKNGKY